MDGDDCPLNGRKEAMDNLEALDALHQGTHAIADRLAAMRAALTAQGFSEYFAEAACLQYSAVLMAELRDELEARRAAVPAVVPA